MKTSSDINTLEKILFCGLRERSNRYALRWALNGFARKAGNIESFFRGGGRVATDRNEVSALPKCDELGKFRDQVSEAQSVFFEAAALQALPILRRALRLGLVPDLSLLRAICKRKSVVGAGFRAVEKWEYAAIRGRDGREVPANWSGAREWEEKEIILTATFRPSLLSDINQASEKISQSISARVAAATSGAARAAVRRSAGDDGRLLDALALYIDGRGGFAPHEFAEMFTESGAMTEQTRQRVSRLKKRLA